MLKNIVLFVCLTFSTSIMAQVEINSSEIAKNVGQKVSITAKVAGIYKGSPKYVLLNMVENYPNQVFNAVIFADKLEKFGSLDKYEGKEVTLLGEVSLFPKIPKEGQKQRIQIILNEVEQIDIVK